MIDATPEALESSLTPGSHETIVEYQKAIRDGIDVIQTDHPVRVLRAIELYNQHDGTSESRGR